MECKYIINLPNGGKIEIPTEIGAVEDASNTSLENSLRKWGFDKKTKSSEIINLLAKVSTKLTPKYFKGIEDLNIVNTTSLKKEFKNLKEYIVELETSSLDSSLPKNILDSLRLLYGSNNTVENLIAINHLPKENDTLLISNKDKDFVFYQNNNPLSFFLANVKNYYANNINEKDLSILLSKYNEEIINNKSINDDSIINIENLNVGTFFKGSFINDEFVEGDFHKLFKTVKGREYMKELINLVDNEELTVEKKSIFKIKSNSLFNLLDPKYKNSIFSSNNTLQNKYQSDSLVSIRINQAKKIQEYLDYSTKDNRDMYYEYPKSVTFEQNKKTKDSEEKGQTTTDVHISALNFLNENIVKGIDLIKLPKSDKLKYGLWVIPEEITVNKGQLFISGFVKNSDGTTESHKAIFNIENANLVIDYRKFASKTASLKDSSKLVSQEITNEGETLSSEEGLTENIIREFARRGSYIKYITSSGKEDSGYVRASYPGKLSITTKSNHLIDFTKLPKITLLRSTKLNSIDYSKLTEKDFKNKDTITINPNKIVQKGDIIKYNDGKGNKYNKVIDTNDNSVFILINYKDGLTVKSISKNTINAVIIENENIDFNTTKKVIDFFDKVNNKHSVRESNYSYFDDYQKLQNGDYAIKEDGDKTLIYKVLNKNSGRIVEITGSSDKGRISIIDLKGLTYVTSRDISSSFSEIVDEVNNWNVIVSTFKINPNSEELDFFIPVKNQNDILSISDNGVPSMGAFASKKSNKYKNEFYINATQEYIKKHNEKNGIDILTEKKLIVNNTDDGQYERKIDSLFPVYGFTKMTKPVKLNLLNLGSYVQLKGKGKDLYRIIAATKENVSLEYNRRSYNGNMITINRTIPIDILFGKDEDSIKDYYFIKGNTTKIKEVLKLDQFKENKPLSKKKLTKIEQLSAFATHLNTVFQEFNLEVVIDEKGEDFKPNENAKISDGKIIINGSKANKEHVLHEFLHVFLIHMKYGNINGKPTYNDYSDFLLKYKKVLEDSINQSKEIKNATNLDLIEEHFVDTLSKAMINEEDFPENMDEFTKLLLNTVSNMGLTIDPENLVITDVLDTTIESMLPEKFFESNNLFKNNVLIFEAEFREWLKGEIENNKLKINCE